MEGESFKNYEEHSRPQGLKKKMHALHVSDVFVAFSANFHFEISIVLMVYMDQLIRIDTMENQNHLKCDNKRELACILPLL